MSEAFGALRSLLARPSAPAWRAALRRINGWEDAHERDEVVLPYAREVLARWPDELVRWAPAFVYEEMESRDFSEWPGGELIQGFDLHDASAKRWSGWYVRVAARGWFHRGLERLDISETRFLAREMVEAFGSERVDLSGLRELKVRGCNLGDSGFATLTRGAVGLERMDVSHNALTGATAEVIADPEAFPRLRWVNLLGNGLGEAGVARLDGAAHLSECEVLVGR